MTSPSNIRPEHITIKFNDGTVKEYGNFLTFVFDEGHTDLLSHIQLGKVEHLNFIRILGLIQHQFIVDFSYRIFPSIPEEMES